MTKESAATIATAVVAACRDPIAMAADNWEMLNKQPLGTSTDTDLDSGQDAPTKVVDYANQKRLALFYVLQARAGHCAPLAK